MRPRRTATTRASMKRNLSDKHKQAISKALKAYHAGKKGRKPVNDNLVGERRQVTIKPLTKRNRVFQNRNLEAKHLKDMRSTNRKLKHALQTRGFKDAQSAIKAQKGFKRRTKIRSWLSKILPKNMRK